MQPRRTLPRIAHALALNALLSSAICIAAANAEEYHLTFPETLASTDLLRVMILTDSAATGSVDVPGLASTQLFAIAADDSQSFVIPVGAIAAGSDVTANIGIRVTADVPVHVIAHAADAPGTEDAFPVLEVGELGTSYIVSLVCRARGLCQRVRDRGSNERSFSDDHAVQCE